MIYAGEENLDIMNDAKNYNNSIVQQICKIINQKDSKIMDFGAGEGTLARMVKNQTHKDICCVDNAANMASFLQDMDFKSSLDEVEDKTFDVIYTSNVLEHIENDRETLKKLYNKLKPNGKLFIYVPAFLLLYSKMDKEVGHFRRYSKKELIEKTTTTGFRVINCHYADSVGFFATLAAKIINKKGVLNHKTIKFYDKWLFPLSHFMDNLGMKYILGKNILLIAQKDKE